MSTIDYSGHKFHSWTCLERGSIQGPRQRRTSYFCRCLCGHVQEVRLFDLQKGTSKSCRKCAHKTHGMRHTKVYNTWESMKRRCLDPQHHNYKYYGGRGITVDVKWQKNFSVFYQHVGDPPSPDHTLDRIYPTKGYEPGNVQWATAVEQRNNRRDSHQWTNCPSFLLSFGG